MEREFCKSNRPIYFLLLIVFLTSCNKEIADLNECVMPEAQIEQSALQADNPEQEPPKVCLLPKANPEANLLINFNLQDFPVDREEKMLRAIERLMIIVNSEEFRQRVLDHEYNGERTFVDNDGLSNEEIYLKIMEGAEKLSPEVDGEIDIDVTLYYKNNSTVGYTYPDVARIWVNDKFFATNSLGKVAANLLHEWTHKIGFGHDFSSTASRPYSVPYGVGTIVKELVDGMTPSSL